MHSRLLTLPGVPHRRQRPARRPGLTEANPEPPGSILEGSSGEGKRLGTDRNGRHRVHLPEHAQLRESLGIPHDLFFWKLRCECQTPPSPPHHTPHTYAHPPGVRRCSAGPAEEAAGTAARRSPPPRSGRPQVPRIQPELPGGAGGAAGPGRIGRSRPEQGCSKQGRTAPTTPQGSEIATDLPSAPLAHGWTCPGN